MIKRNILLSPVLILLCFVWLCCDKTGKPAVEDPIVETPPTPEEPPEPEEPEPLTASDIIFMNSFEDGNLNVWDDWDKNPAPENTLLQDPGPFNTPNNHVMRLWVKPGRGGADVVKVLPSPHDKVYARWYAKWEEGFDFTAKNHGGGLHAGDRNLMGVAGRRPDGADMARIGFEYDARNAKAFLYAYYRGMDMDCADPNGSCWGDHLPCFLSANYCKDPALREKPGKPTPKLEAGKWYCIELLMDMGTPTPTQEGADGVVSFWIDGVEYGPFENLWLRTVPSLKIRNFDASLFHHGEHGDAGVVYDNIVIAKKRIGMNKVVGE
ncbi:hypothetical protein [Sphingobacterium pedocola]|uniref:Uncharacterized protein n=1 Tax=Sphingobacterium pedocola TaxID=2082722 RepID=A0ABR9TD49_9SPHI|nr:hypothetical protein [Sphingobacterium pedocola]MBE8723254.1 hypothetical protein [Sphingobacterium pedocola]